LLAFAHELEAMDLDYNFSLVRFAPDDLLVHVSRFPRLCLVLGWVAPTNDEAASKFIQNGEAVLPAAMQHIQNELGQSGVTAYINEITAGMIPNPFGARFVRVSVLTADPANAAEVTTWVKDILMPAMSRAHGLHVICVALANDNASGVACSLFDTEAQAVAGPRAVLPDAAEQIGALGVSRTRQHIPNPMTAEVIGPAYPS
jgi:hypothetical protein